MEGDPALPRPLSRGRVEEAVRVFTVSVVQTFTVTFEADEATEKSAEHIGTRIVPRMLDMAGQSRNLGGWTVRPGDARIVGVKDGGYLEPGRAGKALDASQDGQPGRKGRGGDRSCVAMVRSNDCKDGRFDTSVDQGQLEIF